MIRCDVATGAVASRRGAASALGDAIVEGRLGIVRGLKLQRLLRAAFGFREGYGAAPVYCAAVVARKSAPAGGYDQTVQ